MQQDLRSSHPLLDIQILGVNQKGIELSNEAITRERDIPWLQDVDADGNGVSDVWGDLWGITYRDVVILGGDNSRFDTYNVTSNDLSDQGNYQSLRQLLIDAAMETQKPWMNASNPLDVNADGFVQPLDVLLVVNKINQDGSGLLPAPTGTELPGTLFDSSGDNSVSPLDVLQIVNFINAESDVSPEGEASQADVSETKDNLESSSPFNSGYFIGERPNPGDFSDQDDDERAQSIDLVIADFN